MRLWINYTGSIELKFGWKIATLTREPKHLFLHVLNWIILDEKAVIHYHTMLCVYNIIYVIIENIFVIVTESWLVVCYYPCEIPVWRKRHQLVYDVQMILLKTTQI